MPNKVNASHILVKTKEEADHILQLVKLGQSFEKLAGEKSLCPSKKKGGSLGWFTKGMMVPEFDKACFNGKKGDILEVKTQFGWHVIRIDDAA